MLFVVYVMTFIVSLYSGAGYDRDNLETTFDLVGLAGLASDAEERSLVFYSLMFAFNESGRSFFEFRAIHFIICSLILLFLIVRFTKFRTYTFACCVFFPLMTFSSQMRNGLGAAFLYLGFYFLLTARKKVNVILFVVSILLATTIHYIFVVYMISLIAITKWKRDIILKGSLIVMFLSWMLFQFGFLYNVTASYLGDYYSEYFSNNVGLDIIVHTSLITGILINAYFTTICDNYVAKRPQLYKKNEATIVNFVCRLNIVFLAFVPMLLISGSFYRVFQNVFVLSVVSIAITSSRYFHYGKNAGSKLRLLYAIFYMFVSIFYLYWQGGFFKSMNGITL